MSPWVQKAKCHPLPLCHVLPSSLSIHNQTAAVYYRIFQNFITQIRSALILLLFEGFRNDCTAATVCLMHSHPHATRVRRAPRLRAEGSGCKPHCKANVKSQNYSRATRGGDRGADTLASLGHNLTHHIGSCVDHTLLLSNTLKGASYPCRSAELPSLGKKAKLADAVASPTADPENADTRPGLQAPNEPEDAQIPTSPGHSLLTGLAAIADAAEHASPFSSELKVP